MSPLGRTNYLGKVLSICLFSGIVFLCMLSPPIASTAWHTIHNVLVFAGLSSVSSYSSLLGMVQYA